MKYKNFAVSMLLLFSLFGCASTQNLFPNGLERLVSYTKKHSNDVCGEKDNKSVCTRYNKNEGDTEVWYGVNLDSFSKNPNCLDCFSHYIKFGPDGTPKQVIVNYAGIGIETNLDSEGTRDLCEKTIYEAEEILDLRN